MRFSTAIIASLLSFASVSLSAPNAYESDLLTRNAFEDSLYARDAFEDGELFSIHDREADDYAASIVARGLDELLDARELNLLLDARDAEPEPEELVKRAPNVVWQNPNAFKNKPALKQQITALFINAVAHTAYHTIYILNGWHTSFNDHTTHATARTDTGVGIHVYPNGAATKMVNGNPQPL